MGLARPFPKVGERFGYWEVLRIADPKGGARRVLCVCFCGNESMVALRDLYNGKSTRCRQCGNNSSAQRGVIKHGAMVGNNPTPEYRAWKGMRERCTKPRHPSFAHYGGRGIKVCEEWLGPGGFERFLAHVGQRPSPGHSIDRINPDGNYEPENVRWATIDVQNRNKGDTRMMTLDGRTQCLSDWARERGLRVDTVHARLRRGWTPERALADARIEIAGGMVTVG